MKVLFSIFCFVSLINYSFSQSKWTGNRTPTYSELIDHLKSVSKNHSEVELYALGSSDYGLPIYVCIVNGSKDSLRTFEKARNETTILINNAIHPGEPDGINACLIWLDKWIANGKKVDNLPVVAFIPAYNVGGMMNRSSTSRANQNGPDEYGFRGNARNLDLNRDFIKMDSENAFTFSNIFHALEPDVFVDNHVSNGADYQYTLTYISQMKERMAPSLRNLVYGTMLPEMTKNLRSKKWGLFPYVELKGETPDEGIYAFNDLPRYAMGYAGLFNSISFTVETHMLKPFPERVQATLAFMEELIDWTKNNANRIEQSRKNANNWVQDQSWFRFNYELSEERDSINFKGYEHSFPVNEITGMKRLLYDRTKPYQKMIPYFNKYIPTDSVRIPDYYIVGCQEKEVIRRLEMNHIKFRKIQKDSLIDVQSFVVTSFKSSDRPYEGHFKHKEMNYELINFKYKLKTGDIIIPTKQNSAMFIHSVLQPKAEDSYFTWNFFDSYLQEKEYFSNYVFIDKIQEILDSDSKLKEEYIRKKNDDESFRNSEWQQLYFIYSKSNYFEPSFMRLPVYQLNSSKIKN
ncbi:MAG: hypothetical protein ACKO7P_08580 [Bacteroidota bacterium]